MHLSLEETLGKRFTLRVGCGYRERLCLKTTAATRIPKEDAENIRGLRGFL